MGGLFTKLRIFPIGSGPHFRVWHVYSIVPLIYVDQNVVQITLINILDQHHGFAQHLGQMIGDDGGC